MIIGQIWASSKAAASIAHQLQVQVQVQVQVPTLLISIKRSLEKATEQNWQLLTYDVCCEQSKNVSFVSTKVTFVLVDLMYRETLT